MDRTIQLLELLPSQTAIVVSRENILLKLDQIFETGANLVYLEGRDGSGRTYCARQFALRHANNAIVLFLAPTGRWRADWQLVRWDLADQIHSLVTGARLADEIEISDQILEKLFMRLVRFVRRTVNPLYFVLDGLDELPEDKLFIRDLLVQYLPLNVAHCRFLITKLETSPAQWIKAETEKTLPIVPLTQAECGDILATDITD